MTNNNITVKCIYIYDEYCEHKEYTDKYAFCDHLHGNICDYWLSVKQSYFLQKLDNLINIMELNNDRTND